MNPSKLFAFWFCLLPTWLFANSDDQPHVVMLIAEREYKTDETLPRFAKEHLSEYRTSFVFADPEDRNRLVGLNAIESADVLLVSVRRRTLPKKQLDLIRQYVQSGKPVIGIRTASHAFSLRNQDPPDGLDAWPEFDKAVFGGNYTNHYGDGLAVAVTPVAKAGEIAAELLSGIDVSTPLTSGGSLYRVSPLEIGTSVVLMGSVEGHPKEPIAWTFQRSNGGKSVYTSLGHVDDFAGPVLPKFLANSIAWCINK